jgi:hypothetical protein
MDIQRNAILLSYGTGYKSYQSAREQTLSDVHDAWGYLVSQIEMLFLQHGFIGKDFTKLWSLIYAWMKDSIEQRRSYFSASPAQQTEERNRLESPSFDVLNRHDQLTSKSRAKSNKAAEHNNENNDNKNEMREFIKTVNMYVEHFNQIVEHMVLSEIENHKGDFDCSDDRLEQITYLIISRSLLRVYSPDYRNLDEARKHTSSDIQEAFLHLIENLDVLFTEFYVGESIEIWNNIHAWLDELVKDRSDNKV